MLGTDDNNIGMKALRHYPTIREGSSLIGWILGAAALLPTTVTPVHAQIAAKSADQGPTIEEIVVTATRRAEPLSKAPKAADLRINGDLAELKS